MRWQSHPDVTSCTFRAVFVQQRTCFSISLPAFVGRGVHTQSCLLFRCERSSGAHLRMFAIEASSSSPRCYWVCRQTVLGPSRHGLSPTPRSFKVFPASMVSHFIYIYILYIYTYCYIIYIYIYCFTGTERFN